ncbi:hypothetical protein PoB_003286600 [Plakobranchus ocellatus]|uniref:Uncharacterized protein n=1 Tax=Plakobranchus ocellatus TaxID=259542 RepID=A0AAV4AIC5_9GAST|nr:hypothetical protein PoB_003286600 [Plakobranchus ocellatus]
MKRKIPSPPPPPLPPVKPRRAGILKTTCLAGAAISQAEVKDRKVGKEKAFPQSRDNSGTEDSIPIPLPICKYTTTNPGTKSPVYHLVYDLTSSTQCSKTSCPGTAYVPNNNNCITASTTKGFKNERSSNLSFVSHPHSVVDQQAFSSTRFPSHLPSTQELRQVDLSAWVREGVQDVLQVEFPVSKEKRIERQRWEEENDLGITLWENRASVSALPAQDDLKNTGITGPTENINAVNGDNDCPPPLPPPRSAPLPVNRDAASDLNHDAVTKNSVPFLHSLNISNTPRHVRIIKAKPGFSDGAQVKNFIFKNYSQDNINTENSSSGPQLHTVCDNIHLGHPCDGKRARDRDRSPTLPAGEGGEGEPVWREARAELLIETPSSLPPPCPSSPRQGVRHELKTADATGISTSVAAGASCVLSGLPEENIIDNLRPPNRGINSKVCDINRGAGEVYSLTSEVSSDKYHFNISSNEQEENFQCQELSQTERGFPHSRTLNINPVQQRSGINYAFSSCGVRDNDKNNTCISRAVGENNSYTSVSDNDAKSSNDACSSNRISVRDAISLWNDKKDSSQEDLTRSNEKDNVSLLDSRQEVNVSITYTDSDNQQPLKKAVFQRHGDSLRFFLTPKDSFGVSVNEYSDETNNAPSSLESYVDPITGKPIDWKTVNKSSKDNKSSAKSKQSSKIGDKHAGILAKVLDLTLSRTSGNNKALSSSLLSPFTSKYRAANIQELHRPRPPINRWDNIHVRSSQTHSGSWQVGQEHVHQTFHTQQDESSKAPTLPPRHSSSSSAQQEKQQLQQGFDHAVILSYGVTSPRANEQGNSYDNAHHNGSVKRPCFHSIKKISALQNTLSDKLSNEFCLDVDCKHHSSFLSSNDKCETDKSHELNISREVRDESRGNQNHSVYPGKTCQVPQIRSLHYPNHHFDKELRCDTEAYFQRDQPEIFPSSINFDTEENHQSESCHPSFSALQSPFTLCPEYDAFYPFPQSSDIKGISTLTSQEGTHFKENIQSANTRAEFEPSLLCHLRGYVPDQHKSFEDPSSSPPPPLPARGVNKIRQCDLSSSLSLNRKQKVKGESLAQLSEGASKHRPTDGDESESNQSKQTRSHSDFISVDGIRKFGYDGDLQESLSATNHRLDSNTVLSYDCISRSLPNFAKSIKTKPLLQSISEDTYQFKLREQCKKNQLWNLFDFDFQDNACIEKRRNFFNTSIGNENLESQLSRAAVKVSKSESDNEVNRTEQEQRKRPLKITPRQKFEILHSRISEKVATNLRRQSQNHVQLIEKTVNGDDTFNKEKESASTPGSNTESQYKTSAAFNSSINSLGLNLLKESPRARFERDRAARTSAVNARGIDISTTDRASSGANEAPLRLNKSCDDLERETLGVTIQPGYNASSLTDNASLQRSFSPIYNSGTIHPSLAPPIPPKPILRQNSQFNYLKPFQDGTTDPVSSELRLNKGDKNDEPSSITQGCINDIHIDRSQESPWFRSDKNLIAFYDKKELSIGEDRSEQRINFGSEVPTAFINKSSKKYVLSSAPQAHEAAPQLCDTPRRVSLSPAATEVPKPFCIHTNEPRPYDTSVKHLHGLHTSVLYTDKNRNEGSSSQRCAAGSPTSAQRGQHQQGFTGAAAFASDNTTPVGSQNLLDINCRASSFTITGIASSSTSASKSNDPNVKENKATVLDFYKQGQQSCARQQEGSTSDPQALNLAPSCGHQKGSDAKKMSPGSVSSSGYESEINSIAFSRIKRCSERRNKYSPNHSNFNFPIECEETKPHTLSTVQQLRLLFGHNPNTSNTQCSLTKTSNLFCSEQFGNKSEFFNTSDINSGVSKAPKPLEKSQSKKIILGTDTSDSKSIKVKDTVESKYSANLNNQQQHLPELPSRHQCTRYIEIPPCYSPKEKTHNRKLLEKANRSMHGMIHDLTPGSNKSRQSPTKNYRSCQHRAHKRSTPKATQSKPETGADLSDSCSASAFYECTVCSEVEINDINFFATKTDTNNNFRINSASVEEAPRDLQSTEVEQSINKHEDKHQLFRHRFFSNEEATMLAAKGLRIYESGEEYIAMRSPVKSPLHKSISAPQFGWEGMHYLIVPTLVEPFNTNTALSFKGVPDINLDLYQKSSGNFSNDNDKESNNNTQNSDSNTNTLFTHRSISDSGTSRRFSAHRYDEGIDASNFFMGHRSDGDECDDERNSFNDVNYNKEDPDSNNMNSVYLPMKKLSACHRAMSVDVLYKEPPSKISDSEAASLFPGSGYGMRKFDYPQCAEDKGGRGYVEWKTCSSWVGKMDNKNPSNGRNSRGYVEWDTIWTVAAPWGNETRDEDEHVYDVIAENSSTCSTEETIPKACSAEKTIPKATFKGEMGSNVEPIQATSVALDVPPALPERTYINKIKIGKTNNENGSATLKSAFIATECKNHHHHSQSHCKKHRYHHHHHHNHSHHHHHHHRPHHQGNQPHLSPQFTQTPPHTPVKPSILNISSQPQLPLQSPSKSSPVSTPTKNKTSPTPKAPPKPPRQLHQSAQLLKAKPHWHQKQPQQQQSPHHNPSQLHLDNTCVEVTTHSDNLHISENYSEVHKLKGYKFTSLLTSTESDSPIPGLLIQPPPDPNAIYSENYCHLGPAVTPQERATMWQSGDVLDYIDGLHDSMSPKRRENIYILLNNKKTRAKFSESLEIESRLLSKGLLSPSPSSSLAASSSSPLPASSSTTSMTSNSNIVTYPTELKSLTSPITTTVNKPGMPTTALTTPTIVTTVAPDKVIKRKGATAPVSSTYV